MLCCRMFLAASLFVLLVVPNSSRCRTSSSRRCQDGVETSSRRRVRVRSAAKTWRPIQRRTGAFSDETLRGRSRCGL
jgi:hypothetical protein